MTDEEKIREVMFRFEDGGLVSKSVEQIISCVSERVLGIGLGEQGFVSSKEEIRQVFESGLKDDDPATHTLEYKNVRVRIHEGRFANAIGEVIVVSENGETVSRSTFQQSLSLLLEDGAWKICGLHATTPVVTEESLSAYPLKIAEKTLQSLKEKIGEEVYQAEEQYRRAVLADTIAFYVVNFTTNVVEKCQLNNDWCVFAEPGTPYEELIVQKSPEYVADEDKAHFLERMSVKSVHEAYAGGENELSCEYRLKRPNGEVAWLITIIRLIRDVTGGDLKGIMYIKNIDAAKRREIAMQNRVSLDEMTGVLNKGAFIHLVQKRLNHGGGVFIMLDVDNFKHINDTYGHPLGDQVLIAVAGALKNTFGEQEVIGRLGGDEFGVFCCGEGRQGREALTRLQETLRGLALPGAPELCITCSIGVAGCGEGGCFEELYADADRALYLSKKNGKDQVSFL